MMKKFPKKVWYQQEGYGYELFQVLHVISPTPYEDFMILQRKEVTRCLGGSNDIDHHVLAVNVQEHPVYPNSAKVRALLSDSKHYEDTHKKGMEIIKQNLHHFWLDTLAGMQ